MSLFGSLSANVEKGKLLKWHFFFKEAEPKENLSANFLRGKTGLLELNSLLFSLSGKFQLLLDLQLSPEAETQRVLDLCLPGWREVPQKRLAFICSQLLRRKQERPKRAQDRRYAITFALRCVGKKLFTC